MEQLTEEQIRNAVRKANQDQKKAFDEMKNNKELSWIRKLICKLLGHKIQGKIVGENSYCLRGCGYYI